MIRFSQLGVNSRRFNHSTALKWPRPPESAQGSSSERFHLRLHDIEKHWKPILDSESVKVNECNPKKYVLSMFPYPSGNLHMGHMRVYTISDVTARYYRLNGFNVVHPIGWDAFGLPAENAARERGVDPREWTEKNIASMKHQLKKTGVQFDWDREISTCDPSFYKWTQWIFCKLHERGLVKRTLAEVNWDPVDGTVLAAEQIDADGKSWRSGAVAEKRKLRQWMVETPKYAKRLSDGLKSMPHWNEVADIQLNWIGECDAYRFLLPLKGECGKSIEEVLDLRTLDVIEISKSCCVIIRQGHALSDQTKNGCGEAYRLPFTAMNVVTGEWMSIIVVPESYDGRSMLLDARLASFETDRQLLESFNIKPPRQVMSMNANDVQEIAAFGGYGGYITSRRLQDWVVSRQRKWGTPIPMILSADGTEAAPLSLHQLPLLQGLPKEQVPCDRFAEGFGYYESDTLDTFFDSSWYYLRYLDPHNNKELISKEAAKFMPVDVYVGGVEHAAVHMFFARFISYFLTDIGVTQEKEPFNHLIPQGIVRGKTYVEPKSGKYLRNDEVVFKDGKPSTANGEGVDVIFEKMSKSKHNGVDPLEVLDRDGIDLTRLQLLDSAAPKQPISWGETDVRGLQKWLSRVAWVVSTYVEEAQKVISGEANKLPLDQKVEDELREAYNYFVRNTSMCLEVLNLHNTALMRLIGFTNTLRRLDPSILRSSPEAKRCIEALVVMMQAYVPHISSELWTALQAVSDSKSGSVTAQSWPQVDADCSIDFMLMINDISCGRLAVPRQEVENLSKEQLLARAREADHKDFLDRFTRDGLELENVELTVRPGFHVTLSAKTKGEVDPKAISNILDELQLLRRQMDKKAKSKKENAKKTKKRGKDSKKIAENS